MQQCSKCGDYNKIEINSLQFTGGGSDRKNPYKIVVCNSIPHHRLNISVKGVVLLGLSGRRRENGKMLFVLPCFFLVVFFSRYNIDIWLATVSLG